MSDGAERFNIGSYLPQQARARPHQRAVVVPQGRDGLGLRTYSHLSFAGLDELCDRYAWGLQALGVRRGDRVLVLVRQGFELIALVFALFKLGAAPVMIDPGMGRGAFLACVARSRPRVMVGIPLAHVLRAIFRRPMESVELAVSTTGHWWLRAPALQDLPAPAEPFTPADTSRDELAAILFTSGSTGPPKGVEYTHGIFDGQVRAIGQMYGIEPGEIEVPAFPLFSLFSVALGVTCVLPDIDPSKPAEADPAAIVEAIVDHGAHAAFGSPAIWVNVARYCTEHDLRLPSLRRILTAGAPIPPWLMERYREILAPGVSLHTPYGATESLPVASIASLDVLERTAPLTRQGRGICVGRPVEEVEVRIIGIEDGAIGSWEQARELATGEVGEVCVRGPMVTRRYADDEEATRMAKIPDPAAGPDAFWHRMGDVGYLDDQGLLWFCGRKAHRVELADGQGTLFSVCCEAPFLDHPAVFRAALVGLGPIGSQVAALVVEPEPGAGREGLEGELLALAAERELTRPIEQVLIYPGAFPVDRRHNSKIHREELASWASRQLS